MQLIGATSSRVESFQVHACAGHQDCQDFNQGCNTELQRTQTEARHERHEEMEEVQYAHMLQHVFLSPKCRHWYGIDHH